VQERRRQQEHERLTKARESAQLTRTRQERAILARARLRTHTARPTDADGACNSTVTSVMSMSTHSDVSTAETSEASECSSVVLVCMNEDAVDSTSSTIVDDQSPLRKQREHEISAMSASAPSSPTKMRTSQSQEPPKDDGNKMKSIYAQYADEPFVDWTLQCTICKSMLHSELATFCHFKNQHGDVLSTIISNSQLLSTTLVDRNMCEKSQPPPACMSNTLLHVDAKKTRKIRAKFDARLNELQAETVARFKAAALRPSAALQKSVAACTRDSAHILTLVSSAENRSSLLKPLQAFMQSYTNVRVRIRAPACA